MFFGLSGVVWVAIGVFVVVVVVGFLIEGWFQRRRRELARLKQERNWDAEMDGGGRFHSTGQVKGELQSRIQLNVICRGNGKLVAEYRFNDAVGEYDRIYTDHDGLIWTGMTTEYLNINNTEFKAHSQFIALQSAAKAFLATLGRDWSQVAGIEWEDPHAKKTAP